MSEQIFEAKAERSRLESLVSQLSIRSPSLHAGDGSRPEMEQCHWAATLAGMRGDRYLARTAEYLLQHCYLQDPHYRKPLEQALLAHVATRVLLEHPEIQLSGKDVRHVIRVGVEAHAVGGKVTYEDAKRRGIGQRRWAKLRTVYGLVLDRLGEAEDLLVDHLSAACA